MTYFLCMLSILLAAVLITDLVRNTRFSARVNEKNYRTVLMVTFTGHDEHVELIVRSILKRYAWQNEIKNLHLILNDAGMDAETRRICEMLAEDYGCITVCAQGRLQGCVGEILGLQSTPK